VLRCDIITLFPELIQPVLGQSMLKQVPEKMLLEAACEYWACTEAAGSLR